MSEVAQSQLDRFDWERGDVLSIAREDAARLAALPVKMFAPPFHALLRWFLGEDAESVRKGLCDPRDVMLLNGLMEHQKGNAKRRGDYLTKQREKSLVAKSRRDSTKVPRNSHGTPVDVPSISISRSLSISDKASTTSEGVALPSAAPPVATDGATIRIRGKDYSPKQVLAMLAPINFFGHLDSEEEDRDYFNDGFKDATDEQIKIFVESSMESVFSNEELDLPEDASTDAYEAAATQRLQGIRNEVLKRMRDFRQEYGKDVLGRVMWRLEVQRHKEASGDDLPSPLTVAKGITDSLKAVASALELLRQTAAKQP